MRLYAKSLYLWLKIRLLAISCPFWYVAEDLSSILWASAISPVSQSVSVFSAVQVLKHPLNPWTVINWPCISFQSLFLFNRFNTEDIPAWDRLLPVDKFGNTTLLILVRYSLFINSSDCLLRGIVCLFRLFILRAGIDQTPSSKSNSSPGLYPECV